ncbi:MAG: glycogen/starch synthase, partial [Chloroflexi bacterium]|nr:glycogen/starch synthase [Chloroflexota bacterium]
MSGGPDLRAPAGGPSPGVTPRRVLMVASEMTPFAKSGGLGDVTAALPRALARLGHEVTVVVPRYRGVSVDGLSAEEFDLDMGGHRYWARCFVQELEPRMRVVLVDHPGLFDREGLYGQGSHDYEDNPRRFAFLSLAALEFARREGQRVDV